jgi:hypothetical protein
MAPLLASRTNLTTATRLPTMNFLRLSLLQVDMPLSTLELALQASLHKNGTISPVPGITPIFPCQPTVTTTVCIHMLYPEPHDMTGRSHRSRSALLAPTVPFAHKPTLVFCIPASN